MLEEGMIFLSWYTGDPCAAASNKLGEVIILQNDPPVPTGTPMTCISQYVACAVLSMEKCLLLIK